MASTEAERFKSAIVLHLGLSFGDDKLDFLDTVLAQRARLRRKDRLDYLRALAQEGPDPEELDALGEALTVTETYFFRSVEQFEVLALDVFPLFRASQGPGRAPRILSSACASGEEPYSLAILLKERFPDFLREGCLRAVDINPAMLRTAAAGVYGPWSLRESPPALRERYFRAAGRKFQLREDIRAAVRFEQRNLAAENLDLWQEGSLDVVFCRNMLMYLDPESAARLVGRMARALAPGGHLFLGHAETLRGLSRDFEVCQSRGVFYYRRLAEGAEAVAAGNRASLEGDLFPRSEVRGTAAPVLDLSWYEVIGRSSQRVEDLAGARAKASPAKPSAGRPVLAALEGCLLPVLELLGRERYAEALEILERLAQDQDLIGEALLLDAVLLSHVGRPAEAQAACVRLLERGECQAGAHYVAALCREQVGDLAAAAEEDRSAVRLDPAFALPVLHLGLLSRRDEPRASRGYFERALSLLDRERPSRMLLFGGGFTRQGLAQICRGALEAGEALS